MQVPLEISLKGDKNILYSTSSEDDGRGNVPTVLQFQGKNIFIISNILVYSTTRF
jgi:hypothetical protein